MNFQYYLHLPGGTPPRMAKSKTTSSVCTKDATDTCILHRGHWRRVFRNNGAMYITDRHRVVFVTRAIA